jgi:hypothetical protein
VARASPNTRAPDGELYVVATAPSEAVRPMVDRGLMRSHDAPPGLTMAPDSSVSTLLRSCASPQSRRRTAAVFDTIPTVGPFWPTDFVARTAGVTLADRAGGHRVRRLDGSGGKRMMPAVAYGFNGPGAVIVSGTLLLVASLLGRPR